MNSKEFNEKYKEYLEEGHYGCSLIQENQIDFLDKCFQHLITFSDFKFLQIKSKFGYYCFYAKNVPHELIAEIESTLKILENERTIN